MNTAISGILLWPMLVIGLLFGSFLNVVGYRIPRGESIVWPRSHCPQCQRTLRPYELVPVLSYLWLRGRCRTCNNPISSRYPALELITAALFCATLLDLSTGSAIVTWCLFWMLMVAVTATDLTAMRVPNVLSIPGAIILIVFAIVTGVHPWSVCLLGALSGFAIMLLVHLISGGKMGMGDVKLYLSIGAMLGPMGGLLSLVLASLAGSLVGIALRMTRLLPPRAYIPFVPFIFIGTILSAFFGPAWIGWYTVHVLGLR